MELVLNGLQWQICLIYLDDIIVFGSNFSEHIAKQHGPKRRLQILTDGISQVST
jgi:hypothetical protein